jgi:hypothetical protein
MVEAAFLKLSVRQGCSFLLALVLSLALSCAHQKQPPSKPSATLCDAKPPTMTLAPKPILSQRIQFLESYLKAIEISKRNREAAQRLLTTYRRLLSVSSEPLTLADREELIQALFGSLLTIEEMYFQPRPTTVGASRDSGDLYVGEFRMQSGMHSTVEAAKSSHSDETLNRSSGRNEAAQSVSPNGKEAKAFKKSTYEAALDLNQVLERSKCFCQKARVRKGRYTFERC